MSYVRSLIVASILAAVAWFIYPEINTNQLDLQLVLSVAVFISVIAGSLLAGGSTGRASTKSGSKNQDLKTLFVGNLAFKARVMKCQNCFLNMVRLIQSGS